MNILMFMMLLPVTALAVIVIGTAWLDSADIQDI